jgi:hypothetical protein
MVNGIRHKVKLSFLLDTSESPKQVVDALSEQVIVVFSIFLLKGTYY